MSSKRQAQCDVQLSEDVSHVHLVPKGSEFVEGNGLVVRAESEGMEIFFSCNLWYFGGGRDGQWQVDQALVQNTNFHMVPKGHRGMIDNDFVNNRVDARDGEGNKLEIIKKPDEHIWKAGNRQYISRPPYWQIKGEHMGVDVDLEFAGLGDAMRYGAWEGLSDGAGLVGYETRNRIDGTIKFDGKTYPIKDGWGDHGIWANGHQYHPVEGKKQGYYFVWCWHEDVQIFIFVYPGAQHVYGHAYMRDGTVVHLAKEDISAEEVERWVDPRTTLSIAVRWKFKLRSKGFAADLDVSARGRSLFPICAKDGYMVTYSLSARTDGQASLPNGSSVELNEVITYVEWGKTVMPVGRDR